MATNATVVRLRPPGFDAYGDPIAGDPEELTIADAIVAPRGEHEMVGRGRNGVVQGLTLYVRATVDVLHSDQMLVDGILYDVSDEPARWASPYSTFRGTQVELVRAEG